MKKKEIYRRNLPHFHLKNQTYFITWMLAGALPKKVLTNLESKYKNMNLSYSQNSSTLKDFRKTKTRNYIKFFDNELHSIETGNYFLRAPAVAQIVANSLHFWDRMKYDLLAYCIMPNHVHCLLSIFEKDENGKTIYLQDILQSIKKFSARMCNQKLNRKGRFWQHESFDRIIRDREDLYWTLLYVVENPVIAGFCENWEEFKWTYLHQDYHESLESDSLSRS